MYGGPADDREKTLAHSPGDPPPQPAPTPGPKPDVTPSYLDTVGGTIGGGPPSDPGGVAFQFPEGPFEPFRFSHYEVVARLGRGGMGEVFKVRNLRLGGRLEALKVISSAHQATPEARERFLEEMGVVANLRHAHVVEVYHSGSFQGRLFFTMSLEEGGDLQRLAATEALPPVQAAEFVRLVALAVEHVHAAHKLLHLDLKPSNVLLSAGRLPRVTDFGLSRWLSADGTHLAGGGGITGTPSYMPPEQARGRENAIGPASDVYSLGAILYEMLTRRPPFVGANAVETLRLVCEVELVPPRDINPNVPARLQAICLQCLDKDPKRRPGSAGELAAALSDYLTRARRKRLPRVLFAAALLVAALLAVGGAYLGWNAWRGRVLGEAVTAAKEGDEFRGKGQGFRALEKYGFAVQRYDAVIGSVVPQLDRAALRLARARLLTRRAVLLEDQRQYDEAEQGLEAARTELETLKGEKDGDPEWLGLLAEVYHNLGIHHNGRNTQEEQQAALRFYEDATRLRQELGNRWPRRRDYQRDLARSYGYMGDTQLELDDTTAAKASYDRAAEIRTSQAEAPDADAEALCLHARDFGNRSYFHEWTGNLAEALRGARERLEYYGRHGLLVGDLPGDYLTERADSRMAVAELELDRPAGPAADVPELLAASLNEYERLSSGAEGQTQLQANLARVHVAHGKYHALRGETAPAVKSLQQALEMLEALPQGRTTAADIYRLALTHALLAKLFTDPSAKEVHQDRAVKELERAVRNGFKHLAQLRRDRGFDAIRAARGDGYARVVALIRANRPTYRGD